MGNFKKNPIVLIIIVLAGIGLTYELIFDPISLIKYVAIIAIFSIILFFLFRFIMQRRSGGFNTSGKKYRQAVKQSKKMYGNISKQKTKRKRNHLKVIDGKKNKNNNGAL